MVTVIIVDPSAPFPLEHTSNDPLPDIQKRVVAGSISEVQEEKRIIAAEITRIQLILENLQHQLKAQDDRIATLKAMISPLKVFPNELISKIFEEYAIRLSQPPWLLGHICSSWREVALTTPNLWNRVEVRLRSSTPTYSSFDKEKELFRRAEKSLISCTILLKRPSPSIYYFFQTFTQYAKRLRHLSLGSLKSFWPLLTLPGGSLSSLESLDLNIFPLINPIIPPISSTGEIYPVITLFEHSPRLRRVSIQTYVDTPWIQPELLPLRLPWAQLTHLFLSPHLDVGCRTILDVLRQCINLVTCRLPIPADDPDSEEFILVELKHLEALEITAGYAFELVHNQVLRQLVLPSLKRIILSSPNGVAVGCLERDIVDLILRSACNVEVFHCRSDLKHDFITALLNTMPSLKDLSIVRASILPSLLRRMAHEDFLPNLVSIKCHTRTLLSLTVDQILDALGETGFMEPPVDERIPLSLSIVAIRGASVASRLEELQRNWLNVSFQWSLNGKLVDWDYELQLRPRAGE